MQPPQELLKNPYRPWMWYGLLVLFASFLIIFLLPIPLVRFVSSIVAISAFLFTLTILYQLRFVQPLLEQLSQGQWLAHWKIERKHWKQWV